ncbi:hypothetical protein [Endothiovibrio diazotrophicus]
MNSNVLIHVGLEKCGSTYLQNVADGAPDIQYVPFMPLERFRYAVFDRDILGKTPQQPADETLHGVVDETDARSVFLSDERLAGWHYWENTLIPDDRQLDAYQRGIARHLKEAFPRGKVLIVARNPRAWINSLYKQHVKVGVERDLEGFCRCQHGYLLGAYSVDRLVEVYVAEFGPDNVLVLPLELLAHDERRFFSDIREFSEIPLFPDPSRRKNESLSDQATEVLSHFNGVVNWLSINADLGEREFLHYKRQFFSFFDRVLSGNASSQREFCRRLPGGGISRPESEYVSQMTSALAERVRETLRRDVFEPYREMYAAHEGAEV